MKTNCVALPVDSIEPEVHIRALEQTQCGVLVADNEGTIVYVNPRICEITGYAPDELLGSNPKILQSGATDRETYLDLWNTISSGRSWSGVLHNRRKSGELYWESIVISPIFNREGHITHFSGILEDITEKKEAESVRSELDAEIVREETRESLQALMLGMAHEMNNSLTGVIAACDLARRMSGDRKLVDEMLDSIESAAKRSAEFVQLVTSLSQKTLAAADRFDLRTAVEEVRNALREKAGRCSLRVREGGPAPVVGNRTLVQDALIALVKNARESGGSGAIEIVCGSIDRLKPSEEEFFLPCGLNALSVSFLEVRDSGPGMDAYTLRRAFNPFYSTKRGQKGLGLAVVEGVMRQHKGAIGVIRLPLQGTAVRLYFPKSGY